MIRQVLVVLGLVCVAMGQPPKVKLWSLQPVTRPAVPGGGGGNPIDAFLGAQHAEKGLKPVGRAPKLAQLRRVYFDLIGLPPTVAEQEAFLADTAPDAYEKVVDRLLADPQHGVKWARQWLDVLRYADLDGLDGSVMPAAQGIHRWRDWMIQALNQDMPYDQFVRAQILGNRNGGRTTLTATGQRRRAGANPQDQFALGFLSRAALTGGDRDQDIAIAAVETISSSFLGMTVGCAKCHDHRFDPIPQRDYYRMKALFDPLVLKRVTLATQEQIFAYGEELERYRRAKEPVDEAIETLIGPYRQRLFDERVAMLPADVRAIVEKPERKRTVAEQKIYDDYFPVLRIDPPKIKEIMPAEAVAKYDALLKQQREVKAPAGLPGFTLVEEDSRRLQQPSYILTSGEASRPEKDKPVEPGFPFQPEDTDFRDGRREGFVDWLTAPENPLFARVAVNRLWQWHFGEGLQKNPSDFGLLGGRPSNGKLLDFLASEFVAKGYSMRAMHRLMVTSEAYRRSSQASAAEARENHAADASNTYLWRFRLQRLGAEAIWDAILAVSGELDLTVGGKSFQPVQPDGKQSIFLPPDGTFESRVNRRAAYMARGYIPSTDVMANFLRTFAVDDGRTPCPVRENSVSAPQALFTMNDPMVERAAGKVAERVLRESGGRLEEAVGWAYRVVVGRPAERAELERSLRYVGGDAGKMAGLVWMLFNLDEFVFVR